MKKVYYTCNVKNSKSKIVFFDSKKEADEYCELMNLANRNVDYRVAAINITSIKEIKSNNYESYKKMLENAIKNLKKELETITDKRHLFDVKFDDGFETYLTLDYDAKIAY